MDLRICFLLLLHAFTLTSGEPPIKLLSATYTDELVGLTSRLIHLTPPMCCDGISAVSPNTSGVGQWSFIFQSDELEFPPNSTSDLVNGVDVAPPEICEASGIGNWSSILKPDTPNSSTSADINIVDRESQLTAVELVNSIVSSPINCTDIPPPECCHGSSVVAETESGGSELMAVGFVSFADASPTNRIDFPPPQFSDEFSANGSSVCVIQPDVVGIPPNSGESIPFEETNKLMTMARITSGGSSSRRFVSGSTKMNSGGNNIPAKRSQGRWDDDDVTDEEDDDDSDTKVDARWPLPNSAEYLSGPLYRGMVGITERHARLFTQKPFDNGFWLIDVDSRIRYYMRLKAAGKDRYILDGPGWRQFVSNNRLKDGDEVWFIFDRGSGDSYVDSFKRRL